MSSSHPASTVSRLVLGAPLLLALSLPWGCARTTPAQGPTPVGVSDVPRQAPSPSEPASTSTTPTTPTTPSTPTPAPAPESNATPGVTSDPPPAPQLSRPAPRTSSRPARDPALASPEVVGTVDRGDLSELAADQTPSVLQDDEIRKAFDDHRRPLQACYRFQKDRSSRGEVVVGFVIDARGRVASLWPVADQVGEPKVVQCLLQNVGKFRFRATPGGTTQVTYTIRYE